MTLTLKLRLRKSVISLLLSGLIESIVLGRKTMVVGAICVPCRLYIWWIVLCFRSICRHESCISHGWSMMRSALETLFMAEKPRAKFRKVDVTSNGDQGPVPWIKRLSIVHLTSPVACKKGGTDQSNTIIMEFKRLKVFLVYRGPTGSVPWTAVGFVFLELLKSDSICGERRVFRPFMRMEINTISVTARSNKIGVNWFPYLQTLLPKFHDVEEQGPPECWAVVVVVLGPWWPWQISQVFFSLDYHFVPADGTDLGGHGRFLGLFSLASSSSSPSLSLDAAGAAADRFLVTEFAVDRWTTRRGPLGGVEDQLSSTFLGFG
uniref:Uncharacterized protein n=1 Tax=Fagus sylvatica TaxID=28930 RepID=A0A2N9GIF3_FAGSY